MFSFTCIPSTNLWLFVVEDLVQLPRPGFWILKIKNTYSTNWVVYIYFEWVSRNILAHTTIDKIKSVKQKLSELCMFACVSFPSQTGLYITFAKQKTFSILLEWVRNFVRLPWFSLNFELVLTFIFSILIFLLNYLLSVSIAIYFIGNLNRIAFAHPSLMLELISVKPCE